MKANFHTHTDLCDGRNTPEEMCAAALDKGFSALGFSSHSDMLSDVATYRARVRNVAELFRDRLVVKCGLEAELAKPFARDGFDYVIGSVHFVKTASGALVPVDHTPDILQAGLDDYFRGESESFVRSYFSLIRETLALDFEVVGHPDLVRKFNARHPYFDEQAAWYRGELEATADAIAASGKLVEVNTGAIARGWLDDAYPSPFFRDLLRARGVKFILSSDAHAAEALDAAFDRFGAAETYVDLLEYCR